MSAGFASTLTALRSALDGGPEDHARVGILARALRWYPDPGPQELLELAALGESLLGERGDAFWEVERAVYEILSERAGPEHLDVLVSAYELRGTHAEDRRRLALQGLSRIAARSGDKKALETLAEALHHNRADTRGWAIGFIVAAYFALDRPLPGRVRDRLRELAETDPSRDVRAEAANLNLG